LFKLKQNIFLLVIIFSLLTYTVIGTVVSQNNYVAPHDKQGPAVDTLKFRAFHVDIAPQEIIANQMDIYYFGLKVAAAREIRNEEGITIHEAPTSTLSLLLNPAPGPDDQLNPFSIKEVRQAVQLIINRDFVVQEIYQGMAVPMLAHVSSFDHDYLTLYDMIRESSIRYDPDYAKQIIAEEMTNAGAELVEGKWHYNGKPIRLDFIIRVEDERRDVGDLIRSEMENLGFTVQPVYQQFGPAIYQVYSQDPDLVGTGGSWHMYTEGWGKGSADRYDSGTLNQMCAPWLGTMPGWQELGFWQYENNQLDDLGQRIFSGNFQSEEERNSIYIEASKICLDESVRIWIANIITNLPAQDTVIGISSDIISGPKSLWSQRDAYIPGKTDLTIGNVWVWTARTTWNPVGGFGDVYSTDIWRNMFDPPITRHPFNGLPIPYRANYVVDTAGPNNALDVPPDAFIWDAESRAWTTVSPSTSASSKVTFDYSNYFNSKWHHGQPIDMADVIYSIYQTFDLTYNEEKSSMEFAIATVSKPYLDTFKGFRIIDENTLEIYVDFWHFAPDYIADYASITGLTMPWEILFAMDTLVFDQRKAAYSDTASQRFNVPWLSLVMDRDSRLVNNVIRDFDSKQIYPDNIFSVNGKQLTNMNEASNRYQAAMSWHDETEMLVISNGPFMLKKYDPPAQYAELIAFRDSTYPFKPGQFYFGNAELVDIIDVNQNFIDLSSPNQFIIELTGEGNLGLRYILMNEITGQIISKGDALPDDDNNFLINFDESLVSQLEPGFYKLYLAGYSDSISSLTERIIVLEAMSEARSQQQAEVREEQAAKEPQVENIQSNSVRELDSDDSDSSNTNIIPIVVALLIIVVGGFIINQRSTQTTPTRRKKTKTRSSSTRRIKKTTSKKTTSKKTTSKKTTSKQNTSKRKINKR